MGEVDGSSGSKSLMALLEAVLQPFTGLLPVVVKVEDILVSSSAVTPLALIFYELCTNSVKYGALSQEEGRLAISSECSGGRMIIRWQESFEKTQPASDSQGSGFGTTLCESTVKDQLDGSFVRTFTPGGMRITLDLSYESITSGS
ncbi:hypothetical protein [Paracoccus sp. SY]|uniref:hypothetical protein n=1 Tax=Paracoccus sp. SY TaxID=1330255 RepID=UPI001304D92B|nr:hypothetical protein [Paracoccus sp. SY]